MVILGGWVFLANRVDARAPPPSYAMHASAYGAAPFGIYYERVSPVSWDGPQAWGNICVCKQRLEMRETLTRHTGVPHSSETLPS